MHEPESYENTRRESTSEDVSFGVATLGEAALQIVTASPVIPGWPRSQDEAPGEAPDANTPLAREIRPKVRLLSAGAEALSSAELLALLFSAFPGTSEARALELANRLISERGGLYNLLRTPAHELLATPGVGQARACVLLAAAELGKRLVSESAPDRPVISGPEDVYALLRGRLAHLDRERFVVLLLTTKNAVISTPTVSIGTLSAAIVHPREVFKPAIQAGAAAVILAHNHPSGHVEPSREDREVTRRISDAGETLGISVIDHLIIGDGFCSLKERGLM